MTIKINGHVTIYFKCNKNTETNTFHLFVKKILRIYVAGSIDKAKEGKS